MNKYIIHMDMIFIDITVGNEQMNGRRVLHLRRRR